MKHARVNLALALGLIATFATHARAASLIEARTASTHPMQYLVSRPENWNPGHTWPVVIIIADARREYRVAIQEFMAARGARPYVLVCPVTLTSGGDAHRIREAFQYPDSAWARASRDGDCAFDRTGLDAVLADVRARDHGHARLPARVYSGERDSLWLGPRGGIRSQYLRGRALAEKLGVCTFSEVLVRGQGRGFYADSVLAWFGAMRVK